MPFQIQKITAEILKKAEKYFPQKYRENFSDESLAARFLISQKVKKEFGIENFFPRFKKSGAPKIYQNIFFSLSHKESFVAVAIGKQKIGIDLEILKQRDEILWKRFSENEWEILGEKNWRNFYFLWTAKEALIKKLTLDLDALGEIFLQNEKQNQLVLQFNKTNFLVKISQKENLICAIAK